MLTGSSPRSGWWLCLTVVGVLSASQTHAAFVLSERAFVPDRRMAADVLSGQREVGASHSQGLLSICSEGSAEPMSNRERQVPNGSREAQVALGHFGSMAPDTSSLPQVSGFGAAAANLSSDLCPPCEPPAASLGTEPKRRHPLEPVFRWFHPSRIWS